MKVYWSGFCSIVICLPELRLPRSNSVCCVIAFVFGAIASKNLLHNQSGHTISNVAMHNWSIVNTVKFV